MKFFNFLKKDKGLERTWAVIDVNDKDFKQQVLRRSYKTAVMVDFWAAWCGPCRQLGPVLEDMAVDPQSEFILAKLDTEKNQRTARKFQIQSIPAVKLFRNGQVVGEFTGARPAGLVKHFVNKTLEKDPPAPRISGSSDPKQRLEQAKQHLRKGRGFEAFVLLDNFPPSQEQETAERLLPLARFLFDMDDGDGLTGLEDLDKQYIITRKSIRQRQYDEALDALTKALELGEEIDHSYAMGTIEGILALLGDEDPITQRYKEQSTANNLTH
jgi:putative thioredoxin